MKKKNHFPSKDFGFWNKKNDPPSMANDPRNKKNDFCCSARHNWNKNSRPLRNKRQKWRKNCKNWSGVLYSAYPPPLLYHSEAEEAAIKWLWLLKYIDGFGVSCSTKEKKEIGLCKSFEPQSFSYRGYTPPLTSLTHPPPVRLVPASAFLFLPAV